MAERDARPTTSSAPRPREGGTDAGLRADPVHPPSRTDDRFWDHQDAAWRSGGPVPAARSGD